MKLPRDVSGVALVAALRRIGYEDVRQRGSHVRVTTQIGGEHHEVIPVHNPIRAKTLSGILKSIARHHGDGVDELLQSFLAFCQTILCRMQHAMGAGELLRTWAHQCSRMTPTTFNEGRSLNPGDTVTSA